MTKEQSELVEEIHDCRELLEGKQPFSDCFRDRVQQQVADCLIELFTPQKTWKHR